MKSAAQCTEKLSSTIAKRLIRQGMRQEEAITIAKERAMELVDEAWAKKEKLKAEGRAVNARELFNELGESFGDARMDNAKARQNTANNIKVYRESLAKWDKLRESDDQFKTGSRNFVDFMTAELVGSDYRFAGARDSVFIAGDSLYKGRSGQILTAMEEISTKYDYAPDHLANTLSDLTMVQERKDFISELLTPGKTQNQLMADAANAIRPIIEDLRVRENRAGGNIGKLQEGYAGPQTHDPAKLNDAKLGGMNGWVEFIQDLVDWQKTMPDVKPEDRAGVLSSMWNTIKNGRDLELHVNDYPMPKTVGSSKHRVLIFKDGDSWVKYNDRYGEGTILEGIFSHVRKASHRIATRERLGNKPEAMVGRLVEREKARLRYALEESRVQRSTYENLQKKLAEAKKAGRDTTELRKAVAEAKKEFAPIEKLENDLKALNNAYNTTYANRPGGRIAAQVQELMGETRSPVNASAAKMASGARHFQSWVSLGLAAASSVTDIAFVHSAQRAFGVPLAERIISPLTAYFKNYKPGTFKQKLLRDIGQWVDATTGHVLARMDLNDSPAGMMNKITNRFHKYSLLTPMTERQKAGHALAMSKHLGDSRDIAWKDLIPEIREGLAFHGFNEQSWNLMRNMTDEFEGNHFVSARNAQRLTESQLTPFLPERLRGERPKGMSEENFQLAKDRALYDIRNKIESQVLAFFTDNTRYGVMEPDAASRVATLRGTRPGTGVGEFLRFATLFKSFPIMAWKRQVRGQMWKKFGNQGMDIPGAASMAFWTIGMGYMALALKDLARGRTPREASWETMMEAMAQGGFWGLYGDAFLQRGRSGEGRLGNLIMGPAMGMLNDVSSVPYQILSGDWEKARDTVIRTGIKSIPFTNLPYTKAAMDYFILDSAKESLSPGYKLRMMRNLKDAGQTSFISE